MPELLLLIWGSKVSALAPLQLRQLDSPLAGWLHGLLRVKLWAAGATYVIAPVTCCLLQSCSAKARPEPTSATQLAQHLLTGLVPCCAVQAVIDKVRSNAPATPAPIQILGSPMTSASSPPLPAARTISIDSAGSSGHGKLQGMGGGTAQGRVAGRGKIRGSCSQPLQCCEGSSMKASRSQRGPLLPLLSLLCQGEQPRATRSTTCSAQEGTRPIWHPAVKPTPA